MSSSATRPVIYQFVVGDSVSVIFDYSVFDRKEMFLLHGSVAKDSFFSSFEVNTKQNKKYPCNDIHCPAFNLGKYHIRLFVPCVAAYAPYVAFAYSAFAYSAFAYFSIAVFHSINLQSPISIDHAYSYSVQTTPTSRYLSSGDGTE